MDYVKFKKTILQEKEWWLSKFGNNVNPKNQTRFGKYILNKYNIKRNDSDLIDDVDETVEALIYANRLKR